MGKPQLLKNRFDVHRDPFLDMIVAVLQCLSLVLKISDKNIFRTTDFQLLPVTNAGQFSCSFAAIERCGSRHPVFIFKCSFLFILESCHTKLYSILEYILPNNIICTYPSEILLNLVVEQKFEVFAVTILCSWNPAHSFAIAEMSSYPDSSKLCRGDEATQRLRGDSEMD